MRRGLLLAGMALGLLLAACAGPARTVAPWPPVSGDGEVGLASWYGRDFHGRRTASGEVYDMYQMTAAHKTLPLGTWVEVIHQETGRSIQVRVNDRGPFIAGRIIDVSYGAARLLGMLGQGVVPVRIRRLAAGPTAVAATTPPGPASPSATPAGLPPTAGPLPTAGPPPPASGPPAPPAVPAGRFTMQLGSFTSRENATALARTLQQRFNGVHVVPAEIDGETVYRVRMGTYPNRQEAQTAAQAVAGAGFDVVVMQQE